MTEDRAQKLRAAFDRGFAEPPAAPRPAHVDLLRVRIGGEPHALAMAEIAAIHVDLRIAAMPTTAAELLGVIAVRAAIVPVYDLRAVLGIPAAGKPRWTVLAAGLAAAFAFEDFDGHLRITGSPAADSSRRFVRGIVSHEGRVHPIVDLTAVVTAVRERWNKER
jgi:chemotaxis signal transduction protein